MQTACLCAWLPDVGVPEHEMKRSAICDRTRACAGGDVESLLQALLCCADALHVCMHAHLRALAPQPWATASRAQRHMPSVR